MNKKQLARLKALLAKASLTQAESAELHKLKALAATNNVNPETGEPVTKGEGEEDSSADADDAGDGDDDDDAKGLSEAEIKTLISTSIVSSFTDLGLDAAAVKGIKEKLDAAESLTEDTITAAIKSALGSNQGVDMKALGDTVKKALKNSGGLTEERVKSIMGDCLKEYQAQNERRGNKHEFSTGEANFPIEHRSGNLSVAQKQLLNLCLSKAPQEALDASDGGRGIKRPSGMNDGISETILRKATDDGDRFVKSYQSKGLKAITAGGAGTGLELVNIDLSSDLQMRLYMESQLAQQLMASEITMPSNPFKLPLSTTRAAWSLIGEGVNAITSNPGTAEIVLSAKKLMGYVDYSYESDEDAIIAILPWLQDNLGKGAADAFETACINGDTTGTHMDSDTTVATDVRKAFKGFRQYAKSVAQLLVSLATGGITAANLGAIRKASNKYGMKPQDLFWLCGTAAYNDIVLLAETLTVDKVGGANRILTGNAPQIFGIPIIPSAYCREDLNATGVYDGTTTTKGAVLLVHRPSWFVGVKRGFTIEVDRNIVNQTNQVVASFRRDLKPKETPSSAERMVVMGYNYNSGA